MADETFLPNERQKSAFKAANLYVEKVTDDPLVFAFVEGAKWADTNREKELEDMLWGIDRYFNELRNTLLPKYRADEAEALLKKLSALCKKTNW